MRILVNLLAIAAVLLIALPVFSGLRRTTTHFSAQKESYQDDGSRYVLPSVHPDPAAEAALRLADSLFMCCNDRTPADVIGQWLDTAQAFGWSGSVQQASAFSSGVVSQPASLLFTISPAGAPLLILQADSLFVAGYEPGTGFVLYRRRAVDAFWPGVALRVSQPATGGFR